MLICSMSAAFFSSPLTRTAIRSCVVSITPEAAMPFSYGDWAGFAGGMAGGADCDSRVT